MARLVTLVAGLVVDWAAFLLLIAAGSVSLVVSEGACGSLVGLGAAPSLWAVVLGMFLPFCSSVLLSLW